MNLLSPVRRIAKRRPRHTALIDGSRESNYSELWSRISRVAAAFRSWGLEPGQRLLIWIPNGREFVVAHFGAMFAGIVSVPVKAECGPVEFSATVEDSRPHAILADARLLEKLQCGPKVDLVIHDVEELPLDGTSEEDRPHSVSSHHPASINYSYFFGEGRAYGAVLTHHNYARVAAGYARFHGICHADRTLLVLPMPHVYSLVGAILSTLYRGATIVVGDQYRPRSILQTISDLRITHFPVIPHILKSMADFHDPGRFDLSRVRHFVSGADFLPADEHEAIQDTLRVPIIQGYGLTECFPVICNPPDERNRPGTLGISCEPDLHYRITDVEGQTVPTGEVGEIELQSPTVMSGYFDAPQVTGRVIRNGWLRTGDFGWIDEAGYLYFKGLKKSIFNVYGNNVDPIEISRTIEVLPGVSAARVTLCDSTGIGLSRPKLSASVWLTHGANLSAQDIRIHCRKQLAAYKVPGEIVIDPPRWCAQTSGNRELV